MPYDGWAILAARLEQVQFNSAACSLHCGNRAPQEQFELRPRAAILARLVAGLTFGADVSSGPSHDKHFFDTFMLVIGILMLVAIGLYFGAKNISARTQETQALQDPLLQKTVTERIKPAGQVAVAGQDNSALEEKQAAPVALREVPGEEVYNSTCVACHGAGLAGAPKFGDKSAWGSRIAKGMDTLHQHAIQGFTGASGTMPAKGGLTDVTDKSIMSAVDYMVSKSK